MGRSPYGERGLKYTVISYGLFHVKSLSLRRAWIEISTRVVIHAEEGVALLTESVD